MAHLPAITSLSDPCGLLAVTTLRRFGGIPAKYASLRGACEFGLRC